MLYRPTIADHYGDVETGLWWSDTPELKIGPDNEMAFMDLDSIENHPLTEEQRDFPNRHWAVARGKPEELGDFYQGFRTRDVVVSQRVADVIEELEPGMHDIIPIPNMWSFRGKVRIERPFCFLNVHASARTVDLERSKVRHSYRRPNGPKFVSLNSISEGTCTVLPGAGEGLHLWRDDPTRQAFMSQTLVNRLRDMSVLGCGFLECVMG
ncbi:MAG: hypothetical protein MRY77_18570 [Rhodobacteraceae bacterium]|nr:hypothetical protein [Paracoccaceae bacterium]